MQTTEVIPITTGPSALAVRQEMDWTPDQVKLIKDTICAGSTDDEFKLFLYTAKRTGLDPLVRQIHAVKRWNSELRRESMAIQVGIDGYRVIAERTGNYAGQDAPVYTFNKDNGLDSATITVYRMVSGTRAGFSATAFYDEYVQSTKDGHPNRMWQKMPRVMLAKCAEALAMRKAFPNDLSGIYTDDEMAQAGEPKQPPVTTGHAEDKPAQAPPKQTIDQNRVDDEQMAEAITILEAEADCGGISLDELSKLRLSNGGSSDLDKMTKIGRRNYHRKLKETLNKD